MKRQRSIIRPLFVAALLAACGGCCHTAAPKAPAGQVDGHARREVSAQGINQPDGRSTDRLLIRRAAYHALLEQFAVGNYRDSLFFLEVDTDDTARLDVIYKGFRVRSAANGVYDDRSHVMRDRESGEDGMLIRISDADIKITDASAQVYASLTDGAGTIYALRLQKRDGAWVVLDKRVELLMDFF